PEDARRNLAYYFAYDYRHPQEVARYAAPLVRRVHAWRTTWRHAELVSTDVDDRLFVFDTRSRAASPVSILDGVERDAYLACDAIADRARLAGPLADCLPALSARGLMMQDGSRYL